MSTWLERPVLAQRDKRWAATLMGRSASSTIGDYGCLLTCAAMLAGITPPEMNSYWIARGGYQSGDKAAYAATYDFRKVCSQAPEILDVSGHYPDMPFPRGDVAKLLAHVKGGRPAVLEVDMWPTTVAEEQHYVLAVAAFGAGDAANIVINDPWFEDQTLLCPRYGVNLGRALIRAIYFAEA